MDLSRPLLRVAPSLLGAPWSGGCTTRIGFPSVEDSADSRKLSRDRLARCLGFEAQNIAWVKQVHGNVVLEANQGGIAGEADALVCTRPELLLLVSVADCCPILLWDLDRNVCAVAHAGWRGLVAGVVPATVDAMAGLGAKASRLRAWIGPSIGLDRFEVGAEVAKQFEGRFVREANDLQKKPHVNLKAVAADQLSAAGLSEEKISVCPDCTFERQELYWSYRRDGGICGRQIAYLGMRAG